ncbi:MAG: hypothetical protein O6826_10985 [Acidobacteria bacterium]|nr:hypothetical protein [Acidobacteriota bacterium]
MTCKQVERILAENISAVEEADVQAHIRSCSGCEKLRRELQSMEKLSRLLGETVESPSDFSSRLQSRLSEVSSGWQAYWRPVFVVSLVTLISVGFLWVREVQVTEEAMLGSRSLVQEESVSGNDLQRVDAREDPVPYVDVILSGPSESEYILRLSSRIKIQTTHLNHDFYLEHASY